MEARRTLANYVGCVVAGSHHETTSRLLTTFRPYFGPPVASLFGRPERADPLHAAMINGTANNVYGFDDTHLDTIVHPGGPVLAALFALSETHGFSGRVLLDALVIGVDVSCRVARALNTAHVDAGWHVSSTAGTYGAAAACARVLGLTTAQVMQLFGTIASQPTGLRANFGTMTVSLHIGLAARNGLAAALLAQTGFTSHENILDLDDGWGKALTSKLSAGKLVDGLGESFEIVLNSYKPYASGVVTHPIIDGCRDLSEAHDLQAGQVAGVALEVNPLVHELTGRLPTSTLRSKVSVQHAAAVGIARRAGGIAEFSEAMLSHPDIVRLRNIVTYKVDARLRPDEATVAITLADGRVLNTHVEHARGSRDRPMSDDDLRQKFMGLTAPILPDAQAGHLFALCLAADELASSAEIATMACPMARGLANPMQIPKAFTQDRQAVRS